jgi:hypothetical protein
VWFRLLLKFTEELMVQNGKCMSRLLICFLVSAGDVSVLEIEISNNPHIDRIILSIDRS